MTEQKLDALQYAHWLEAWKQLDKAQSLSDCNRRAKAQEALTEALSMSNMLPRWFTDEQWKLKWTKLHNKLYTGVE